MRGLTARPPLSTSGHGPFPIGSPPSPHAVARDGFAFVRAPEMRALLEQAGLARLGRLRRAAGTISASTPTWPMAGATAAAASPCFRASAEGDRPQAASAALPEPRLQPAERRHRALVRPGDRRDRRASGAARDPGDLPPPVRPADPGGDAARRPGMSRSTSSASRRGRPGRPADPGGHAPRRRRLGAGAAGQPGQHRERRDQHRRPAPCGRSAASP